MGEKVQERAEGQKRQSFIWVIAKTWASVLSRTGVFGRGERCSDRHVNGNPLTALWRKGAFELSR